MPAASRSSNSTSPRNETPEAPGFVQLRLLGQPRLLRPDGTDKPLERRDAALLALLALDGPQPRALLARWLWPDGDEVKALRNLRQRLFRLRRSAALPLVQGLATLSLSPGLSHDVQAQPALDQSLESRELLGGCDYADCEPLAERVEGLRQRWRATCIAALEAAADRLNAQGRIDEALAHFRRALLLQPNSERAWHRLIQAEHAAGDGAQALSSFERCREALARLATKPSPETLALVDRIRSGQQAAARSLRAPLVTLARPPRLVGRDREWARMREAWQQGRAIVVRGTPGIGKSRLCADLLHSGGHGVALKLPLDGAGRPYALLDRLWQAVAARLPAAPEWADHELARLNPAVLSRTAAPSGPVASGQQPVRVGAAWREATGTWLAQRLGPLWIDDMQWADAASLDVLLPWLEPGPQRPLVLLSLRDDESVPAFDAWLDRRGPDEVLELTLEPLDELAVLDFVASLDLPAATPVQVRATARALLREVGGHPFRMLEWLRADLQPAAADPTNPSGPTALVGSLARRVLQLPAGPLRLLRVAALAGGEFSVPLAAELLGVHAVDLTDDWRSLSQAQLMQEDGTVFDLVVEAARASVPAPIARHLHERLAEVGGARQLRPDWVADQWSAAGQWMRAADALVQAARHAARVSRPAEALAFWDRAADSYARAGDAAAQWRAEFQAVDAAGVAAGAQDWLARARRLLGGAPPAGPDRCDALFRLGRALYNVEADVAVCLPVLEQALSAADADVSRQLSVCSLLLPALAHSRRHPQALGLLAAMERAAAGHVRDEALQLFRSGEGQSLFAIGRYADSASATEVALSIALERGDLVAALLEAGNLIAAYRSTGNLDRAAERAHLAIELWDRQDRPSGPYSMGTLVNVANLDVDQGRFDRALELGTLAREHFLASGSADWCTVVEARLFRAWLQLGQPTRARQALSPLPADARIDRRIGRLMQECLLDSALGQPVLDRLQAAVQQHLPELLPRNRLTLQLQLADALPPEPGLQLAREVLQQARASDDDAMLAPALVQCADALRRLGRGEEAAHDAAQAWAAAERRAPFGLYWVEFCWAVHEAATVGGRFSLAHAALRSGLAWIKRALPHVPPEYVDSFRFRNPANRALLARTTRPDATKAGVGD